MQFPNRGRKGRRRPGGQNDLGKVTFLLASAACHPSSVCLGLFGGTWVEVTEGRELHCGGSEKESLVHGARCLDNTPQAREGWQEQPAFLPGDRTGGKKRALRHRDPGAQSFTVCWVLFCLRQGSFCVAQTSIKLTATLLPPPPQPLGLQEYLPHLVLPGSFFCF